jgi:D-cysteine desulfhydrase
MNLNVQSVVVPSGSAGTHAGLAVGFAHFQPDVEVVGVTVSRLVGDQQPKVEKLQRELSAMLDVASLLPLTLWDDYFAPRYGMPNTEGCMRWNCWRVWKASCWTRYTGKAMAGLIDGVKKSRFNGSGPVMFIHTGGAPALFAYYPHV